MAYTYSKIASYTVGSGGISSINFIAIPQNYTDLIIKYSLRVTATGVAPDGLGIQFNNDTGSNYKYTQAFGVGNSTGSNAGTTAFQFGGQIPGSTATTSTFGNGEIYIPNYTLGAYKSSLSDSVTENNGTNANQNIIGNLWNNAAPITSIRLYDLGSTNFVQYSTAHLYGIKAEL